MLTDRPRLGFDERGSAGVVAGFPVIRAADRSRPGAFTLIELLIVIAIVALLIGILLPALRDTRRAARTAFCSAHLQQLGRAQASYSGDFADFLGALSGEPEMGAMDNSISEQVRRIVDRFDDRAAPLNAWADAITTTAGTSVAEQYEHLALVEYLSGRARMPIAVCPEDPARLGWARNPYAGASWAYRPRKPSAQYNIDWFPYSSSYQLTPAAAAYAFSRCGEWVVYSQGRSQDEYTVYKIRFGRRTANEVPFPSMKVAMMDSLARHFGNAAFYAYPDARQPLLFWDGSVSVRRTGDANPGWFPTRPESQAPSTFQYIPDPGYEPPARVVPSVTGRYKWTRGGLSGVDFGGDEVFGKLEKESRAN
jgi:prepilin-type N-terminal cleavage/methylation domain-containing protein